MLRSNNLFSLVSITSVNTRFERSDSISELNAADHKDASGLASCVAAESEMGSDARSAACSAGTASQETCGIYTGTVG